QQELDASDRCEQPFAMATRFAEPRSRQRSSESLRAAVANDLPVRYIDADDPPALCVFGQVPAESFDIRKLGHAGSSVSQMRRDVNSHPHVEQDRAPPLARRVVRGYVPSRSRPCQWPAVWLAVLLARLSRSLP